MFEPGKFHLETKRGTQNGKAVLNRKKVLQMREWYADGMDIKDIAERVGCTPSNARCVVTRKTWRHI